MTHTARRTWWLVGLLSALTGLVIPHAAEASTYGVHECTPAQGTVDDATIEGDTTGYTANNTCGQSGGGFLQMGTSGVVGAGQGKQWAFRAPAGTKINRATGTYLLQGQADNGGHRTYFFYRGDGQVNDTVLGHQGAGNSGGGFDSSQFAGPLDRIGVGVNCNSGTSCPNKSGIYSRIGDLGLSMEDGVAPDDPVLSGPALDGWINGTKAINFTVSDIGAGVYVGNTAINGTYTDLEVYCSPAKDGSGSVTRMKPCPSGGSGSTPFDTSNAAVVQGTNVVSVCAFEYGESDLQAGCQGAFVKVDTIAPAAPSGLSVAGGEGWKRDNDFDLSWTNPAQPNAPIVGAEVRITGPGNYDHTDYFSGSDLSSIDDVSVPAKGDYTAQLYLRDAAGNESASNSSSVHLRFDNTVPAPKDPDKANGWISREELVDGYVQGWQPTFNTEIPPSGIAGYRVVVNSNSDTDPCSGAVDPRACSAPITETGIDNRSRTLHPGDLQEGANYVHVVPISGSGMRATDVRHTPLKADFTDPVTQLQGDGNGAWINHDASLALNATDDLSGMQDTPEFPFDDPPLVILDVDGSSSSGTPSVSTTVSGEGVHTVSWCARDLAGNGDCPSGGALQARRAGGFDPSHTATLRIDKTAPTAAFTNSQDPDDPDKLVAPVSDALSGVTGGEISYRQADGDQWKALDTALEGEQLVARVDSGDLKPGVTYEFRVQASDRAGNSATSTSKQNGEPMRVTGPFRTLTSLVDLKVNGKAKARVKYGKKPKVTGELVTEEGGRAVPNASVDLVSTYLAGSKLATDTVTVTTDGQGSFSAALPKGPSRTIVAAYGGDRRFLGASSAPAKANVKSRVSLKVPNQVDSDSGIAFTGRVKAKGAKLGRRGKRLAIQVYVQRKWKTVGNAIRTNEKGAYKLPYEFTADYPRAITYTFRAVVLREAGFPYLPSKSKKRAVTVTP